MDKKGKSRKIFLVSLGCARNLIDTEIMMGKLATAGWKLTSNASVANCILINTCGFIDQAKKEALDTILEYTKFRKKNASQVLIVAGCLVEGYGSELLDKIPEIDAILTPAQIPDIVSLIENIQNFNRNWQAPAPKGFLSETVEARCRLTLPHVAYLKISEGCNNLCSYCVISKIRGSLRSRSQASLIAEAQKLAEEGVQELILVAQDTTAYGLDKKDLEAFENLIIALAEIDLPWLRILYAHPNHLSEKNLKVLASSKKALPYLDLPLQHISDPILNSMNRSYNAEYVLNLLDKIHQNWSKIALRTTLMVGFPGETEKDFELLCKFVQDQEFASLGVFIFSPQKDTPAAKLKPQISNKLAQERQDILMAIQQNIVMKKNQKMIGNDFEVIIDKKFSESSIGRAYFQAPEVDGVVLLKNASVVSQKQIDFQAGSIIKAKIDGYSGYDLTGEILERIK